MPVRLAPAAIALGLCLLTCSLAAQELRLSEILASNEDGLRDEDGDSADWVEIHNRGAAASSLDGWFLTDDPGDLEKWRFPAVSLPAGGFLVAFASGKDRAVAGAELHASFRLAAAAGGYLALVRPDGRSIADELSPYPEQREDISFGLAVAADATTLVAEGAAARVLVPTDGALGATWTAIDFDDASWLEATTGVGFGAGGGPIPPDDLVNLAPGKAATQSSNYGTGQFPAALAVDGSFGNFTHTAAGVNLPATWEVDLGGTYAIQTIVLHNRLDCCGSRLRDIRVLVLNGAGAEVARSELLNPENELGSPGEIVVNLLQVAGGPVSGARVRVTRTPDPDLSGSGGQGNSDEADVLSLAEVEVLGAESGPGSLAATDIESLLRGVNASAYVRVPFEAADPASLDRLLLRMRYDDGFIAYLNGAEIARRNAPTGATWSSAATAARPPASAGAAETIDVSSALGSLVAGRNVLAIHGLNASAGDDDFLVLPELVGEDVLAEAPRYFRQPTPGAPNGTSDIAGFVADTQFSVDRGFHDAPIEVEITTATGGATIRYTLDGTAPGPTSGTVYTGPIAVARTTTLRALAAAPGLEPTNVDTHTYLFLDDIVRQTPASTIAAGFPATWGGTSADYGMDPDVIGQTGPDRYGGKYAATIRDDLLALPALSIVLRTEDLFGASGIYTNSTARGSAWERSASIELIHPDGAPGFQIDAGLRIHGGAFRDHGLTKKHSLRLLFKDVHGSSKLRFPLFGDGADDTLDGIVLRANSNDGWQWSGAGSKPLYVRDSFGRQSVLDMGGVASHETFVHLYLNGVYWGLYNPVERPDDAFCASYFGGEREEWDSISNGEAHSGSLTAYNAMLGLARGGLSSLAAYQRIQGLNPDGTDNPSFPNYLDVDNYIDYMITNLYAGNTDWPNKNYWLGGSVTNGVGFKHFLWDSEWSMGIQSDLGTDRTGVSTGVAEPFAALKANAELRLRFADHVHRHWFHGGVFFVDPARPAWDPAHPERNRPAARLARLAEQVRDALVAESARWGDQHAATPYTRDEHWQPELASLLGSYSPNRSRVVLDQFRAAGLYPPVTAPVFSQSGGAIEEGFELFIEATSGTVHYTLDGSDPRLVGGAVSPRAIEAQTVRGTPLIAEGASARVLVPADGALGLEWTETEFDDGAWQEGPTGIGYETQTGYEALIGTDVGPQMIDLASSVYVRIAFDVGDPGSLGPLTLRMKFDDGYVAYLNGVKIAERNAPASAGWSSRANQSRADDQAVVFDDAPLDAAPLLRSGRNVLAIHGLNSGPTSADLLILPRLEAADLSAGAGIPLDRSTIVRARALDGGVWSALEEATFVRSPLRITELHYHPAGAGPGSPYAASDFEFLEIQNTGTAAIDLAGVRLEGGIDFDFTGGAVRNLAPGAYAVVVHNLAAFAERHGLAGIAVAGEYSGKLSDASDRVSLRGAVGEAILDFSYFDTWHPATDGEGYSLVKLDAGASPESWGEGAAWRPSLEIGGSPGRADEIVEPPPGGLQLPADANQDGRLDISDATTLLGHLFLGAPASLPCEGGTIASEGNRKLADSSGDGRVDLTDAVHVLGYLFLGGAPPALGVECVRIDGCPERCGG